MKYSMYICSCGRIHMIPNEKINEAITHKKILVYICGGCGSIQIIGADEYDDGYNMFSYKISCNDKSLDKKPISLEDILSKETCRSYSEILFSPGIRVPMKTGEYARMYIFDRFYDTYGLDYGQIERHDIKIEEIFKFIKQYQHDQKTVDMARFIRETPDEYLDEISKYYIEVFNWNGTKWDRR